MLFRDKLLKDYQYWQSKLLCWLNFGAEDRKVGIYTIKSLYQGLGEILKQKVGEECTVIVKVNFSV